MYVKRFLNLHAPLFSNLDFSWLAGQNFPKRGEEKGLGRAGHVESEKCESLLQQYLHFIECLQPSYNPW